MQSGRAAASDSESTALISVQIGGYRVALRVRRQWRDCTSITAIIAPMERTRAGDGEHLAAVCADAVGLGTENPEPPLCDTDGWSLLTRPGSDSGSPAARDSESVGLGVHWQARP